MRIDKHLMPVFSDVNRFIASGDIFVGNPEESMKFDDHVTKNYPFIPVSQSSMDWKRIENSKTIKLENLSNAEIGEFINLTTVSNYEDVAVIYSAERSNYIMKTRFLIENFDLITNMIVPLGYFVGIENNSGVWRYNFDSFLEWKVNNAEWLSGIMK